MNARRDGGAAFPRPHSWDESPVTGMHEGDRAKAYGEQSGMTLRDYFAAHAPPYPFNPKIDLFDDSGRDLAARLSERDAKWRFVYADAMLTERAK